MNRNKSDSYMRHYETIYNKMDKVITLLTGSVILLILLFLIGIFMEYGLKIIVLISLFLPISYLVGILFYKITGTKM
ncbi:MAG: hypothetical protein E6356_14085 [Terrisporobacter othiniensis]|nr:hypothetical protein [Terrisporobacter othiniensis]